MNTTISSMNFDTIELFENFCLHAYVIVDDIC